jgi:hypothetical protein
MNLPARDPEFVLRDPRGAASMSDFLTQWPRNSPWLLFGARKAGCEVQGMEEK